MNLEIVPTELKACPFCGGAASACVALGKWVVYCNDDDIVDGCPVKCETAGFPTMADAYEAWNTRSPTDACVTITRKEYDALLIGGNHLASALMDPKCRLLPNDHVGYQDVLEIEGQPFADMWVAWRAIMDISMRM